MSTTTPASNAPPKRSGPNAYTVILGLTLLMISVACVVLVMELRQYGDLESERKRTSRERRRSAKGAIRISCRNNYSSHTRDAGAGQKVRWNSSLSQPA